MTSRTGAHHAVPSGACSCSRPVLGCGGRCGHVCADTRHPLFSRVLQNCHDDAARFVHLLMNPGCNYLVQEDFIPFLQVSPVLYCMYLTPSCRFIFIYTVHTELPSSTPHAAHSTSTLHTPPPSCRQALVCTAHSAALCSTYTPCGLAVWLPRSGTASLLFGSYWQDSAGVSCSLNL